MTTEWVFLRPIDRVYFGSPRALGAGEVHSGCSEFPPSPYTVAGMLRTHLLEGAQPRLDLNDWSAAERSRRAALVGTAERLPDGWQLCGPFPAEEVTPDSASAPELEPWLPLPAWIKFGRDGRFHPHQWYGDRGLARPHAPIGDDDELPAPIGDDDELLSDGAWVGTPRVAAAERAPSWVPASALVELLRTTSPLDMREQPWFLRWSHSSRLAGPPFVKFETAPGVGIDARSRVALDSMLYSLEMLRFAPGTGLLVSLQASLDLPLSVTSLSEGIGRAGRKGQAAAFESAEGRLTASWRRLLEGEHLEAAASSGTFWLYLATPARMSDPYCEVVSVARELAPRAITVSLLSIAIGEPQVIGGLAIDGARARDNVHYARGGSAWLLRLEGGSELERRELLSRLHGQPLLGPKAEQAFGFGLTFVGFGPSLRENTNSAFDSGKPGGKS